MPRPEWIEVGRISRPHGVHGEVRVILSSDNPDRFLPGSVFHARPARSGVAGARLRQQVRLTVESVRGDEDFPIVAFREIADREAAEGYRGHLLEVRCAQLPELDEDEFYPFDLVGLEVRDPEGTAVGRVTEALESPAHALLAVRLQSGPEVLVPFVAAAVPLVLVAEGYLVVEPRFLAAETDSGEEEAGEEGAGAAGARSRP